MKDNFAILAHARSGSTSLFNIFISQDVKAISEPYNHHNSIKYLDDWGKNGFESSLDMIFSEYKGMKHLFEFTIREQTDLIKEKCNTIILYRENMIDAAISLEMAFKTNVWLRRDKKSEYGKEKILLDRDSVEFYYNYLKKIHNFFDDNCFIVRYEDLYYGDDQKKIIYDMFDFVGCEVKNYGFIECLLHKRNKINDKNWCDLVSNWEEIKTIG